MLQTYLSWLDNDTIKVADYEFAAGPASASDKDALKKSVATTDAALDFWLKIRLLLGDPIVLSDSQAAHSYPILHAFADPMFRRLVNTYPLLSLRSQSIDFIKEEIRSIEETSYARAIAGWIRLLRIKRWTTHRSDTFAPYCRFASQLQSQLTRPSIDWGGIGAVVDSVKRDDPACAALLDGAQHAIHHFTSSNDNLPKTGLASNMDALVRKLDSHLRVAAGQVPRTHSDLVRKTIAALDEIPDNERAQRASLLSRLNLKKQEDRLIYRVALSAWNEAVRIGLGVPGGSSQVAREGGNLGEESWPDVGAYLSAELQDEAANLLRLLVFTNTKPNSPKPNVNSELALIPARLTWGLVFEYVDKTYDSTMRDYQDARATGDRDTARDSLDRHLESIRKLYRKANRPTGKANYALIVSHILNGNTASLEEELRRIPILRQMAEVKVESQAAAFVDCIRRNANT